MSFREKFIENWGDDITKMTITRKLKIGNLIFLLFQPFSCKFDHFKIKKIMINLIIFLLKKKGSNLQERSAIG